MDGVHDLGGVEGFGRLPLEENEPVFHHDWESRAKAMRMLMGFWRKWNIDAGRHSIEKLPPADYLGLSYYEKWLASVVGLSVDAGLLTLEEIRAGRPDPSVAKTEPPVNAAGIRAAIPVGRPSARDLPHGPAFQIGARVRTARHGHSGHTRLPRYLRDAAGEIVLHHGGHVLPDVSATMTGEAPEHLYSVRFRASDLWSDGDAGHKITADLWESYLAAE